MNVNDWDPARLPMKGEAATGVADIPTVGWVFETKLDGHRALFNVDDTGARMYAGSGNEKTGKLPHVEAVIGKHFPAGTWLDGEVVYFTEQGDDRGLVQSVLGSSGLHPDHEKLTFVAFDMLAHGGLDATRISLSSRRELLEMKFQAVSHEKVLLADQFPVSQAVYDEVLSHGFEGVMAKRLDSLYLKGRKTREWLKLKATATEEVVITGYEPGKNGFAGLVGAVRYGQFRDGLLVNRGTCSGMTMRVRRELTANGGDYLGRVLEIAHLGIQKKSGAFLSPQWKGLRDEDDKPAGACTWTEHAPAGSNRKRREAK